MPSHKIRFSLPPPFVPMSATACELDDLPVIRLPTTARTLKGFRDWSLSAGRPPGTRIHFLATEIWIDFGPEVTVVRIPTSALTPKGFRAWMASDTFPDHGRISFLDRELHIDMSPEEIETHAKVKAAVSAAVFDLNEELDLGEFLPDRVVVVNDDAGLRTEPDGTFVKWSTYRTGKVRLVRRREDRREFIEVSGRPDWIMEIVSRNSVFKDTKTLPARYHRARIPEYWLIDARGDGIDFRIFRRGRTD